jgi:hypothetical protein
MSTIQELNAIVSAGETAQYSLDAIAESIYDTYLGEISTQRAELTKEFPSFDGDTQISDLERGNDGFYSYRLDGNELVLRNKDYFRGETNYEYDSLPATVFIDDEIERNRLIHEFVKTKIDALRVRLVKRQEQENEQARLQYEALKERFES